MSSTRTTFLAEFRHGGGAGAIKVPSIIALFWVVKILTTGMGETTSDFLVHRLGPVPAVLVGAVVFAAALWAQFAARAYRAAVYWTAVAMVSVFGTMVADVTHLQLGVPYVVSTIAFSFAVAALFASWYATERTLSIHSIRTPRRELFYWSTVVATFALGTAAGDMTARSLGLGYFASGVLFAVLFALPAIGFRWFGLNEVFAFWFAYVITRPLGASFADWAAVPHASGGLGLGDGLVSLVLAAVIVALVAYLAISRRDAPEPDVAEPSS